MSVQSSGEGGSSSSKKTKKKIKVKTANFSLSSSWTVSTGKEGNAYTKTSAYISSSPTISKTTKKFKFSLPSGATVKKAYVYANINLTNGISTLNANGVRMQKTTGQTRRAKVKIKKNSGKVEIVFAFRAVGKVHKSAGQYSTTCRFSNVYLQIEYYGASGGSGGGTKNKKEKAEFKIPPQNVCIYDQGNKTVYLFDGVTKIQHAISVDIQENPEGKEKSKYVNNAKNQPDEVTIDILMSDVYTSGGATVKKGSAMSKDQKKSWNATKKYLKAQRSGSIMSRSEAAYYTLHWLKEKRRKISIVTPQYVYIDMIISSITVNQDDACPFGWEGQIKFKQALQTAAKTNKKASTKSSGSTRPSPSVAWQAGVRL